MNPEWRNFLLQAGAHIEDGRVSKFKDRSEELSALGRGTILTDLSDLGVIRFSGDDAQTFLQGQLTSDVRQVTASRSQYSSYCTPKGRMLATFLLWRDAEGYCMQLPASLREQAQKRLTMYVLRSKVIVKDVSTETVRLGVAGQGAAAALSAAEHPVPGMDFEVGRQGHTSIIRLPGNRYEIVAPADNAAKIWDALKNSCVPVGAWAWEWYDIQAGIPKILPATQEAFVPQMANFDVIGGVSFNKGCYPGQEIVARTQYLGKLKRRMYLARLSSGTMPAPGDELFTADMDGQSTGTIVNAQESPEGGYDILAVIQTSSAESQPVHWKSLDGPALELKPLPYAL